MEKAPVKGWYHRLPAGTQLPEGLAVIADGNEVNPALSHGETHHTIYPTRPMTVAQFNELLRSLPWEKVAKKL